MADVSHEEVVSLDREHVLQTYKRLPVTLVRGEGTKVWDANGKEYLDFLAGIAVVSLGHCHPAVVEAVKRQAETLMTASNYFYTEPPARLARLLCELSGLDRAFFCNSGAEAVEACIKLARKWGKEKRDGAYEIIVTDGAFHGRTLTTVSAGANEKYRAPFTPLTDGFVRVPYNDVAAVKQATGPDTAAVLVEPVQGEGGVNVPDEGYLRALRQWCDETGILLLLDEVQTGIGRTGRMFAYQHEGIEPDAVALAKGLGGGFPIGAMMVKERCAVLTYGEHGTTFGGNPLACAVGYSVLQHIAENGLIDEAARKGQYLMRKLESLADRHAIITEVRGKGLLIAVELDRPVAEDVVMEGLKAGLIVNNVKPTALRLVPPLTVSEEEIDWAVEVLDSVLSEIER